jgi:hypothetical protein
MSIQVAEAGLWGALDGEDKADNESEILDISSIWPVAMSFETALKVIPAVLAGQVYWNKNVGASQKVAAKRLVDMAAAGANSSCLTDAQSTLLKADVIVTLSEANKLGLDIMYIIQNVKGELQESPLSCESSATSIAPSGAIVTGGAPTVTSSAATTALQQRRELVRAKGGFFQRYTWAPYAIAGGGALLLVGVALFARSRRQPAAPLQGLRRRRRTHRR